MPPCNHEEVDTRLIIHLHDALFNGYSNCMVPTVDTYVVVILIDEFHHLMTLCVDMKFVLLLVQEKNLFILTLELLTRSWAKRNLQH